MKTLSILEKDSVSLVLLDQSLIKDQKNVTGVTHQNSSIKMNLITLTQHVQLVLLG